MDNNEKIIKTRIEHFLWNSDISTHEIANMFGLSEEEVLDILTEGTDYAG